jgi:hypothetical protein
VIGGGAGGTVHRKRESEAFFGRQKVERGLLLLIHFLCLDFTTTKKPAKCSGHGGGPLSISHRFAATEIKQS